MKKALFIALAVWTGLTEIILGLNFNIEAYKSSATKSIIARDGTSSCFRA